jgi:hypothetical protein
MELARRARHHAIKHADTSSAISCPVCGHAMQRRLVNGVVVDLCGNDGTWFDGGELEAIVSAGARLAMLPIVSR